MSQPTDDAPFGVTVRTRLTSILRTERSRRRCHATNGRTPFTRHFDPTARYSEQSLPAVGAPRLFPAPLQPANFHRAMPTPIAEFLFWTAAAVIVVAQILILRS